LCHLPNTQDPNDREIFESVSRLGGGVWADAVIRRGVSERLREWLGDGATDAVIEVAAKPVMDYWRDKIQPILFPSDGGDDDDDGDDDDEGEEDDDEGDDDDDDDDKSYKVPVAPGTTYKIFKYVAPEPLLRPCRRRPKCRHQERRRSLASGRINTWATGPYNLGVCLKYLFDHAAAWWMPPPRRIANNLPLHSRKDIDAAYDKPIRAVLNVISELFRNAHAKGVPPQVGPRPVLGPRSRYDALGRTGTDVGRKRESS
jgi:hypothetical protein